MITVTATREITVEAATIAIAGIEDTLTVTTIVVVTVATEVVVAVIMTDVVVATTWDITVETDKELLDTVEEITVEEMVTGITRVREM